MPQVIVYRGIAPCFGALVRRWNQRVCACLLLLGFETPCPASAGVANATENRRELTLKNGLHVVLIRDDRRPRVAVAVSYHAGVRDDPEGYRGLARVTQSLMSHGSRHIAEGQVTRMLERAGARSFGATVEPGGETSVYLASSPLVEGVTGKYFDGLKERDGKFRDPAAIRDLEQRCDALLASASASAVSTRPVGSPVFA